MRTQAGKRGEELEAGLLRRVVELYRAEGAGGAVAAGVSGGMDSLVLAEALRRAGLPLTVLHYNHRWRGEASDRDAAHVAAWCRGRGVPVRLGRARAVRRTEAGAREQRLEFFAREAARLGGAPVWLGHHAEDLAETFFLQLLRGAGPEGLSALRPARGVGGLRLVRPLLGYRKAELRQLARRWRLEWREDASNRSGAHARNRVRRGLLPSLRRWAGRDPLPMILRTVEILGEESDWIERQAGEGAAGVLLECARLRELPAALQRRRVRRWLGGRGVAANFQEVEAVRGLALRERPARVNLRGGRHARRTGGKIRLEGPAVV